jgi:ubiquinone biosynthesis protein COQ4
MAMTDTMSDAAVAAPKAAGDRGSQPIGRSKREWWTALKALRRLLSDKEDTGQVFEIMRALNGDSGPRNYARLLSTPRGGRIAFEHVELEPLLMDGALLETFAPGTVGAAYRGFIRSENFSAQGLADVSRNHGRTDVPHPYAWFGRRIRDSHDIWHILSGYHADGLGEACLVAFSFAQTGSLGWALIALGAGLRSRGPGGKLARKAIWQGYKRGKAAAWLPGEDYVALLSEPLEAARQRLGITPASWYDAMPREARDPRAGIMAAA